MAELFQSQWNEIKTRQSQQDLTDLIALLDRDGNITIEDDPTEDEIRAAREKAAADAEAAQKEAEAEAEAAQAEADKQAEKDAEAAQTAAVAALPLPEDNPPPAVEGQDVTGNEGQPDEETVEDDKPKGKGKKAEE